MKRLVLVAVALAALAGAPTAAAKSCARIAFAPEHPRAGAPTELRLSTWLPRWENGNHAVMSEPLELPVSYRLELTATGPDGSTLTVKLRRDNTKPHVWRARVLFPRAGLWRIESPALWTAAPRSCSPARAVRVG